MNELISDSFANLSSFPSIIDSVFNNYEYVELLRSVTVNQNGTINNYNHLETTWLDYYFAEAMIYNNGIINNYETTKNKMAIDNNQGATFNNYGNLTNDRYTDWDSATSGEGIFNNYGYLYNDSEGAIRNYGTLRNYQGSTFDNNGYLLNCDDGVDLSSVSCRGYMYNDGNFNNNGNLENSGPFSNSGDLYNYATFSNIGIPDFIYGYSGYFSNGSSGNFYNYGDLENDGELYNSGNLENNGNFYNYQYFENNGSFENNANFFGYQNSQFIGDLSVSQGAIFVGFSGNEYNSSLTIEGDFSQDSSGVINLVTNYGAIYDQANTFKITGNANILGGQINIQGLDNLLNNSPIVSEFTELILIDGDSDNDGIGSLSIDESVLNPLIDSVNSYDSAEFDLEVTLEGNHLKLTINKEILSTLVGTQDDDNSLYGTTLNDLIQGLDGDDKLKGKMGNDHLQGGNGNDILFGNAGANLLEGGAGDDVYIVNSNDIVTDSEGNKDTIFTYSFSPELRNYYNYYGIENITLLGNQDLNATGDAGNNKLIGNNGDNVLNGSSGTGRDIIKGKGGNDTLIGGGGNDILVGGAGDDSFELNPSSSFYGIDRIKDFTPIDDTILIVNDYRVNLSLGEISPEQFVLGTSATTPDHRFIYYADQGILGFDADGNGSDSSLVKIGKLSNKPADFSHTDIVVV